MEVKEHVKAHGALPIIYGDHKLVDSKGKAVLIGKTVQLNGQEVTISGGLPPKHIASTGRVWTSAGGEFFPHVFHMKWVPKAA
jgi:hypothetical protein